MAKLDSQQISLIGRNLLVGELLHDGLEVARPERDRGVDLVAYVDIHETGGPFIACPIQLKVGTDAAFAVDRKYERFPSLLIAYLWHLFEPAEFVSYCLTYPEAVAVAESMGWTSTASWAKGSYTPNNPSARLLDLLSPHRMGAGRWVEKIRLSSGSRDAREEAL